MPKIRSGFFEELGRRDSGLGDNADEAGCTADQELSDADQELSDFEQEMRDACLINAASGLHCSK